MHRFDYDKYVTYRIDPGGDIDVYMAGYACGAEDLEIDDALEVISQNYGV